MFVNKNKNFKFNHSHYLFPNVSCKNYLKILLKQNLKQHKPFFYNISDQIRTTYGIPDIVLIPSYKSIDREPFPVLSYLITRTILLCKQDGAILFMQRCLCTVGVLASISVHKPHTDALIYNILKSCKHVLCFRFVFSAKTYFFLANKFFCQTT